MDNRQIYNKADKTGKEAVEKLNVRPMVVQEHANALDDNSPVVKQWFVADGPCGFAWVNIRPASKAGKRDCDFVSWLRTNRIGSFSDYDKAWHIGIGLFNQSIQKKETYADAFAKVLREYGVEAYADSRLD